MANNEAFGASVRWAVKAYVVKAGEWRGGSGGRGYPSFRDLCIDDLGQ